MEDSAVAAAVAAAGPSLYKKTVEHSTSSRAANETSPLPDLKSADRKDSTGSANLLVLSVANLPQSSSGPSSLSCSNTVVPADDSLPRDFDPKSCQSCQSGPASLSSISSSEDTCDGSRKSIAGTSIGTQQSSSLSAETVMSSKTTCLQTQVASDSRNNNCKEKAAADVANLQSALACLQEKLTQKDIEIARLSRIRDDVEAELEDLTASLFEEAHRMVREANVKQASAEKVLVEARMKIDGLETEVAALKTMVLTSTPSQPNKHLHPQLDTKSKKKSNNGGSSESVSSHGIENGSASPTVGGARCRPVLSASSSSTSAHHLHQQKSNEDDEELSRNIDPGLRMDYLSWRKAPTLDRVHPFMKRIYSEDVDLCLDFPNEVLIARVNEAIHQNSLCLSPVKDFSNIPRNCALLDSPVLCKYILRLSGGGVVERDAETFFISQLARNRLAAVCDCLNYLRYIHQGLVKSHVNDVYWEIMRLRRHMVVARLGFSND